MEQNDLNESKPKKKMSKKIRILIILIILMILSATGIFVYSKIINKPITEIVNIFAEEEKEYTLPLEEFLVNLNSEFGDSKQYLRINITLMYTDTKQTEKIQTNISLVRDLIISNLRDVTVENALQEETMTNLKQNVKNSINIKLGEDLIKEVYITDLIIK